MKFQQKIALRFTDLDSFSLSNSRHVGGGGATKTAKFAKKAHKPPLSVNVLNFELNGFNASIWVPWSPSDPQKL